MTISLFCKSRPTASFISPHEGEYRMIEIIDGHNPPLYFDLPDTLPAETCDFRVYWHPSNNLVRFKDEGFHWEADLRSESILDLKKQILFTVVCEHGRVYLATLSMPMDELTFPEEGEESRVPSSNQTSSSMDGDRSIVIGGEVAHPVDSGWTKEIGAFIGAIAPGKTQAISNPAAQ